MKLLNDLGNTGARGWRRGWSLMLLAGILVGCKTAMPDRSYRPVFDQASLLTWGCVPGGSGAFEVQEGVLASRPGREGRLFTEREYGDFVLRFEYQGEAGATCGLALRASAESDPAVMGILIELGSAPDAGGDPAAGHGTVAGFGSIRGGYLRGAEKWNQQEIICEGRRIRSILNGRLIQEVDFNQHAQPEVFLRRPGLLREKGQIGLVARGGRVMLRGLTIKELTRPYLVNQAPEGFRLLFDGRSLRNWEGLVADPPTRATMPLGEAKVARIQADHLMIQNWEVRDGALLYRGKGFDNLSTREQFGNFELLLEWQIREGSDSGVYLRGSPQVQIWDRPAGSGGLFNNQIHPSQPLKRADRYPGTWNRFRIIMVGERVTVLLNDELVTHDVVMENYWDRSLPIYERGPVELQAHETPVAFRNISIRELP